MLLGAVLQLEGGGEREGDCFWLLQRRRARGLDAEEASERVRRRARGLDAEERRGGEREADE
ncbi:hypothetical protein OIU84_024027, partial [Salix udensis]